MSGERPFDPVPLRVEPTPDRTLEIPYPVALFFGEDAIRVYPWFAGDERRVVIRVDDQPLTVIELTGEGRWMGRIYPDGDD